MELTKYQKMFPTAFKCDTSCHELRQAEISKAGLRPSPPGEERMSFHVKEPDVISGVNVVRKFHA